MVPVQFADAVVSIIDSYSEQSRIPVNFSSRVVAMSDARMAIVAQAEEWGADYICIGARGMNSAIDRMSLPLGSVADYISKHAPCSVILVRKKNRAQQQSQQQQHGQKQ